MKIEHVSLWVADLTTQKNFYLSHFSARAAELNSREIKANTSCFLIFNCGLRLELITAESASLASSVIQVGFSIGSVEAVNNFYRYCLEEEINVVAAPCVISDGYGDSYYMLLLKDPENNLIEITV